MIQFRAVSKQFPGARRPALAPCDLELPDGTVLGLVGRNGAGKTTLLRLAAGVARPSTGKIEIDGRDVILDPVGARRSLGWVPETPRFEPSETPRGLLVHLARLDGHDARSAARRAEERLAQVDLGGAAEAPVRSLSLGQVRRLSLAVAWLEDPRHLLYDEVTNALDLPGRRMLEASLERLRAAGGSAIFASHRLDEVEAWCDRVMVLDGGRFVASLPTGAAAAEVPRRIRVLLDRPPETRWEELRELGRLSVGPTTALLELAPGATGDPVADLLARGFHLREVASVREDVAELLGEEAA